MHKKGELSGMKAPTANVSARQAGIQFQKRSQLKSTSFKTLNEKISVEVKASILGSVILKEKTLSVMSSDFVLHKNLAQTRTVFAWLADCEGGNWDKCIEKFSPQFTSEAVLKRFSSLVGSIPAKSLNLALASREGAEQYAPVSLKNWVVEANVSRGARVVTDDVHSKSWDKMSKVERQALRTTIQTLKGATFGNKLADGTPL
jgi:hypothetical protein